MKETIAQFGHEETTAPVALTVIRAALVREIGLRRRVYPRWVHEGRNNLTREDAVREIAAMEGALQLFDATASVVTAAQGLRDVVLLHRDSCPAEVRSVLRRIELLDVALARFDRYKVEREPQPSQPEESSHAPEQAFR